MLRALQMQVLLIVELNEVNMILPACNISAAVLWLRHTTRDRVLEEPH